MKLLTKIEYANAILQARLFNRKIPLVVSWEITKQCNARCKYCYIWDAPSEELGTAEALSMIDELKSLGTKSLHFTGGEPLLRQDIGTLLEHCHTQGISTSMNSNGSFVPLKINEIARLSLLKISLDGPEEVHDYIRGDRSYREAIEGIVAAKNKGMNVWLTAVLSKYNLHAIDFLLEKAAEFDAPILFQPATELVLGKDMQNPLMPEKEKYRQAIKGLILKKKKTRCIANSISGLKFLYTWPEINRIHCLANLISCRIESDGRICICYRNQIGAKKISGQKPSFKDVFSGLPFVYCDRCCCAPTVEINCLLSLKLDTLTNSYRYYL
ncbi:MAG TPA: radical SAM protein [Patescibacteria group bacterium]|nr:radical SAM protein [Patescibacteria group bacterium]